MNRLWVRLSLAFSAVVLVAVAIFIVISVLISAASERQTFVIGNLQAPGGMVEELVGYYRQHQSWEGVETLFAMGEISLPRRPGEGFAFSLTGAEGQVIYSAHEGILEEQLRHLQDLEPLPILVDGYTRGYLSLIRVPDGIAGRDWPSPLQVVSRPLGTITLIAGVSGILFGILMSRSLTAPLNRLAEAAHAIGARKLTRRVEVKGSAEIVKLARAFNDMAAALEEAETLRRNLVADVAHELRTPLTVLQGNLRAILDDVYPLSKTEVVHLYDETRLLSRLVNDLHELSQAEARQLPLNLQLIDLSQLIDDTAATFGLVAESQGVAFHIQMAADLPPILADCARLSQVLHNLLDNALRHTPESGTISLLVERDEKHLRLAVRDTGDGIGAEHLPHVFERFYRADSNHSRETGGTGLGLAIVRAIVEAHDGHVTVTSDGIPGHGATFTVDLPLHESQAADPRI
jgi:signal transduction histidine kinase